MFLKFSSRFGRYKLVEPGNVSEPLLIPDDVAKPSYYSTGEPSESIHKIDIKDPNQILLMKKSCTLAANILKTVGECIKVCENETLSIELWFLNCLSFYRLDKLQMK